MNKFRNNLHAAFFKQNIEVARRLDNSELLEVNREADLLKRDVIKDFESATNNFLIDVNGNKEERINSKYDNSQESRDQLKSDHRRFMERLNLKKGDKKYPDIWNEKIIQGFGHLVTVLRNNKYFEGKNEPAELLKIKQQYWDEVKNQYVDNVWFADNARFDATKDNLFGVTSLDYPANKIYCDLTGAPTIFKTNRVYTEGYSSEVIQERPATQNNEVKEGADDEEKLSDRQNRNFLSDDLTKYLWDIRKTSGVLKALNFLPIFSVKEDRPSKIDREAINDFLKVSTKINVPEGKDPAVALLEVFHDNKLNMNSSKDVYKQILESYGITLKKEKYLKDIVEAGSFYISTQREDNSVRNQHAIYLSVLTAIENKGGVEETVNFFKPLVEQAEKDKKSEKKEGYEKGEKLLSENPELYQIAKNLGVTDFASATRLAEKTPEYFANTPLEKILANLNNDRTIDAGDAISGGFKSGTQFLEIFKQVGKEKSLSNLVKHAKLLNKTLGVGLPDQLINADTIESDIKGGHTGLILLLQSVINKPGEDLYTLLSGEGPLKGIDMNLLKKAEIESESAARDMVAKMDLEGLKNDGVNLPEIADIQKGLAGTLYAEYTRGIGLGSQISFGDWLKSVKMNTGVQFRDDGTAVIGLGLSYSKTIKLGKGWSTTPGASADAFIPLGYGTPELTGSISGRTDISKERLTSKNGVRSKFGLEGGATLMPVGVTILSAGFAWERDKSSDIETKAQMLKGEMESNILSILETIHKNLGGETKLDLNNKTILDKVKTEIRGRLTQEGVKSEDIEKTLNATVRLLSNYNNYDISNQGIRTLIAQGVAEQYAMAWSEYRKDHVSDEAYLSGANLGIFWVAGSPLVGIYAGIKFTKHDLDGYGDRWGEGYTIDHSNETSEGVWTENSLKSLNEMLGLTGAQELKFKNNQNPNEGIIIPKSIANRVKVGESMKQLLVKDAAGNILMSPWTTMGESMRVGSATQSRELFIGEGDSNFVALDTVNQEWFAQDMQDINKKILVKENKEHFYTQEGIKNAINKLKAETKNDALKEFNPTDAEINALIGQLNNLSDKSKKAKIIIERQSDGKFTMTAENGNVEGNGLDLEYRAKLEMFDSKAKELADKVYEWAASLTNPNALNSVKHPLSQRHPDYENFVNKLMGLNGVGKDVQGAKGAVMKIIEDLNKRYPNNILTIQSSDWPTDSDALEQALMSINNVFARSTKVKGKGSIEESDVKYNQYEFTTNMGAIIAEREGQIGSTLDSRINGDINENVRTAYGNLMKAMAAHRKSNPEIFATKTAKAAHLNNAVGFNLGDKYNPENPLLNPEIYEQDVTLDNEIFTENDSKVLHRRAIENFIGQSALFKPIKEAFGISLDKQVKIKNGAEFENGEIELDIGGKIVKLKSDMKFGYFTQCVNHTVILDNIQLEDEQGNIVSFSSGTWKDGRYVEGNKSTILSSTTVGVSVSVVVHDGTKKEEAPKDTTTDPGEQKRDKDPANSTPGATDGGTVDTGGNPSTGGTGDSGSQSGDRTGGGSDSTPTQTTEGQGQNGGGGGGGRDAD